MDEFDSLFEEHQISVTLDEVVIKLLDLSPEVLKPTCVTENGKIQDNHYEIGALEYLRNEYERMESDFLNAKHAALEQEFYEKTEQQAGSIKTFDSDELEILSDTFEQAKERLIEGKRIYDLMLLERERIERDKPSLLELDYKPDVAHLADQFTKESVARWSKEKLGRSIPEWDRFNRLHNVYDGSGPPYSNALLEVLYEAMREYDRCKHTKKPHKPSSLAAWLVEKYGNKEPFREGDISVKVGEVMFKIANFDR